MQRQPWRFLLLVAVLGMAREAAAQYPPFYALAEQQPPTQADWNQLYLRRLQRCTGENCPKPFVYYGQIEYYLCPEGVECGTTPHRSFRGEYGSRHPLPYYIPSRPMVASAPIECLECLGPGAQKLIRWDRMVGVVETESVILEPESGEGSTVQPAFGDGDPLPELPTEDPPGPADDFGSPDENSPQGLPEPHKPEAKEG